MSIIIPLTIFSKSKPKKMKKIRSVINRTNLNFYIEPPIVPDTYKSRMHPGMESHAYEPACFIISNAYVS